MTSETISPVALGPHGPQLSPIVAGVWRMAEWGMSLSERTRWVEQCLGLGVTSFDHADIYGDYSVEGLFGQVLSAQPSWRSQMQIVTKCGIKLVSERRPSHRIKSYDTSSEHVQSSVEASLRALKTDYIDVLLIHRPDVLMAPDELALTFEDLRASGKVRHFGVSNHTPSQLALLNQYVPLCTHQIELSPLQLNALDDGTLDQCMALQLRPMIWSPLAGGRLFQSNDARACRVRATLEDLGQQYQVSALTLAYAWILRHPSRPLPITGSSRVEVLQAAVAALGLQMSREDWYRVWQAGAGRELA